jgi:uncharacterized protein (DUF1778 family)
MRAPAQKKARASRTGDKATERVNLRATKRQILLLEMAARETRANLSAFMIESSCLRAEEVLSSKQHFEIRPANWNQFVAALDRPPQQKPSLRKLMTEPSVLEQGR